MDKREERELHAWHLFNDEPAQGDSVGLTRSDIVSRRIILQLREAQNNVADKEFEMDSEMWEFARFGLFAGLGQGKTSVLKNVISSIKQDVSKRKLYKPGDVKWSVIEFDAAQYESEKLEFSFNHFIHSWLLFASTVKLAFYLFPAWMILGAIYPATIVKNPEPLFLFLFKFGVAVVLLLSVPSLIRKIFQLLLHQWESSMMDSLVHRSFQEYWRFIGELLSNTLKMRPTLLVIDNLDRANLKQQRSVLRSLYKNQHILRFHVIVAMDEDALLKADPDPEQPDELLRKIIQVEFRLPGKVNELVAFQAVSFCRQFFIQNKHLSQSAAFFSISFVTEFVQILTYMHEPSPRHIKRMLNDIAISIEEFGTNITDADLACIAKIQMLYCLDCRLRNKPETVVKLLEFNSNVELKSGVSQMEINRRAELFLDNTINIQPALRGLNWRRLLGVSNVEEPSELAPDFVQSNNLAEEVFQIPYANYVELSEVVLTMVNGHGRPRPETNRSFNDAPRNALLFIVFSVNRANYSSQQRLNFFRCMKKEIKEAESCVCNRYLLSKLWVSDSVLFEIMSEEERTYLLQEALLNAEAYHYLLGYVDRSTIVKESFLTATFSEYGDMGRDFQRVREYFETDHIPIENHDGLRLLPHEIAYSQEILPANQINSGNGEIWQKTLFTQIQHLNNFQHNELPDKLIDTLFVHGAWNNLDINGKRSLIIYLLGLNQKSHVRTVLLINFFKKVDNPELIQSIQSLSIFDTIESPVISEVRLLLYMITTLHFEETKFSLSGEFLIWAKSVGEPVSFATTQIIFSEASDKFWLSLNLMVLENVFSSSDIKKQDSKKVEYIISLYGKQAGKFARTDLVRMEELHSMSEYFEDILFN